MKSLFIDTSSSRIILAILENEKVLKEINEANDHSLSSRIFPLIDQLFHDTNCNVDDIKRIYVVNGPGSFTGIRVGVTIAKTYAWAKKIEIIPISELELLATTTHTTDYVVPYIDARREAVYAGIYAHGKNMLKDSYITIDQLKQLYPGNRIVSISYDHCDLGIDQIEPCVDIEKIVEQHKNDTPINPHEVNPMYLKRTEAEENLDK